MNKVLVPVNVLALTRAMEAIVGQQTTSVIVGAYQVIDRAMHDGYRMGQNEANALATEARQHERAAFTNVIVGVLNDAEEAWDDGFVDGVRTARVNPTMADATIEEIMSDAAQRAADDVFNPVQPSDLEDYFADTVDRENAQVEGAEVPTYDHSLVQDSGDETK